ncbi:MAG: sn-glycerol-3-phosphate ABC transporter ATP-binding protein UgpC [Pseudomonadota bacterium]
MPEIRLQNLVKSYGPAAVIHGLDLTMNDNEFTVLVGPSGCGKSTTLRMVAGLETVTSGTIHIGDREVSRLEPKERDLAMVFQDYALYPHMNVERNMSFALRLARYPRTEIKQRVQTTAAMLGLESLLHRKPAQLSGGQRQRVAMGRALVRDTSTLLMDEPLSNLDAKLRGQMRAELALMRKAVRKNIIYVTHDQIEAMTLGDRIVVMAGGHIQQQGSPEQLYKEPVNRFVAGFVGAPPMNFLEATVEDGDDGPRIVGDGFSLAVPARRRPALATLAERRVGVGIRPAAFVPTSDESSSNAIRLPVLVSEYIGAHSVLVSECGGTRIAVEIKSDAPIRVGETMTFAVAPDDIYLFDPTTETTLY